MDLTILRAARLNNNKRLAHLARMTFVKDIVDERLEKEVYNFREDNIASLWAVCDNLEKEFASFVNRDVTMDSIFRHCVNKEEDCREARERLFVSICQDAVESMLLNAFRIALSEGNVDIILRAFEDMEMEVCDMVLLLLDAYKLCDNPLPADVRERLLKHMYESHRPCACTDCCINLIALKTHEEFRKGKNLEDEINLIVLNRKISLETQAEIIDLVCELITFTDCRSDPKGNKAFFSVLKHKFTCFQSQIESLRCLARMAGNDERVQFLTGRKMNKRLIPDEDENEEEISDRFSDGGDTFLCDDTDEYDPEIDWDDESEGDGFLSDECDEKCMIAGDEQFDVECNEISTGDEQFDSDSETESDVKSDDEQFDHDEIDECDKESCQCDLM